MNISDLINGLFELFASFFVYLHILQLKKDKTVKGLSILAVMFFTTWGYWNCYFYNANNLTLSWIGRIAVAIANTYYVYLLLKYKEKK